MNHILADNLETQTRESNVASSHQVTAPCLPSSPSPRSSTAQPGGPSTPKRPVQTSVHTPAAVKVTSGSSYRAETKTDAKRTAVISGLPKMIPEVPLNDYFAFVLPPVPKSLEGKLDTIVQSLKASGLITTKGRWQSFPTDPKNSKKNETVVFKGLKTIFDAVVAAAIKLDKSLEQNFELFVEPNTVPFSQRNSKSRPDGFIQGKEQKAQQQHKHAWPDLAHPQEYKLGESQSGADDDAAKIVYSMQQIMALDPRRRFTTATTIENRTTRLWFLSRASFFTTESFDFMKDHKRLVHLYLSLAFSSPTDSGWDPSIRVSHIDPVSQERTYEISISTKQGDQFIHETYTTVSILSEVAADSAIGRATRVWLVLDSSGERRVLKDVWMDTDRLPEHEIREAILNDVLITQNEEAVNNLRRHMLTPLTYCKVCVDGMEDDTTAVMIRGYDLSGARMIPFRTPHVSADPSTQSRGLAIPSDRDSVSHSLSSQPTLNLRHQNAHLSHPGCMVIDVSLDEDLPRLHARYHYRAVFQEFATTVYDERSLGNVLRCITDIVFALWIIHLAGWVHRDISAGNVYWYECEDSRSLLGDFEYSRRRSDLTAHKVRTGTPYFMAAETLSHSYLFWERKRKGTVSTFGMTPSNYRPIPIERGSPEPEEEDPPFCYNPLHDLESLWWILVYVLFFNEDKAQLCSHPSTRQIQMNRLFDGQMETTFRRDFFQFPRDFRSATNVLSPTFAPALQLLLTLSDELHTAYKNCESNYPQIDDSPNFAPYPQWLGALQSKKWFHPSSTIELVRVKASIADTMNTSFPGTGEKRKGDRDSEPLDNRKSKRSKSTSLSLQYPSTAEDENS